MGADDLISKALATRDKSLAAIKPPLDFSRLPKPLPKNVIPLAKDLLTEEEIAITGLDVPELLAAIRTKKYTCLAVTKAFLRRAALAQELVYYPNFSFKERTDKADRSIALQNYYPSWHLNVPLIWIR